MQKGTRGLYDHDVRHKVLERFDLKGVLLHGLEVKENEVKEGAVELGLEDGEIISQK